MKKTKALGILFAASLLSLPLVANADSWYCPFTDYFSLNISPTGKILSDPKVEGNLAFAKQSDTFFSLSCANNRRVTSGDVQMEIGFNDINKCTIVLHDGPYVVNPSVTEVKCQGEIYFNGIDHMTGSHNYTLKFN